MASGSKKVIYAALVGNALIAITKFVAASFSGSSAMLSEGIHSIVDTGNQALLLHGMRRAKQPASAEFPFGHGKEIYFWSFVVALLIFAVGAVVSIYQGVLQLQHPHPMEHALLNYVVLGMAMLFEGGAWVMALREFRRIKGQRGYIEAVRAGKDPTVFVVLFEDSAAMLGLIVAMLGIMLGQITGWPQFDGIAAIVIGLILATTAIWLAWETKSLLIGESADPETVGAIRSLVASQPCVDAVNEIATVHMGPEYILVNISLDFATTASSSDVEEAVSRLDAIIKQQHPQVKRVFIEAESRLKLRGGVNGSA